jgi:2-amino-4-hydroxy-6-hydroxymethyldihydropteridine diphosphokinase
VERVSSVYETEPLGPPQPRYLNAAVLLTTALEPEALLDALLRIEASEGRERRERWGPRTLDLDVLWIEGRAVRTARIEVPHPGLKDRAFALLPLLELVPDAVDPLTGQRYAQLALDASGVRRLEERVDSLSD